MFSPVQETTRAGIVFMAVLGVYLPNEEEASTDHVEEEVAKINALIAKRPINSLIDAPVVTDPQAYFPLLVISQTPY